MRKPRFVEYQGKRWRLSELAAYLGIPYSTLEGRIRRGHALDVRQRTKLKPIERRRGHVATKHPLYRIWIDIRDRCSRPGHKFYYNYGGRGVRVCEAWDKSFWQFVADVGERPGPEYSLDRIDNTRGYEPGNTRWATWSEQQRNTRQNRRAEWQGESLTIAEWAERFGVTYHQFWGRWRHYKCDMAKTVASVEKLKGTG